MKTGSMLLTAAGLILACLPAFSEEPEKPPLMAADCIKCHKSQPLMLANHGGRHRSELSCPDCHAEHPPHGTDIVAPCSRCHANEPHFELDDCLQCHTDPHMPLVSLKFPAKPAKRECLSCHARQAREITDYPSGHAEQSCTFCHDRHDKIPECGQCHEPHAGGQTTAHCLQCHPAHHPLQIEPWPHTPIKFCRPCHAEVAEKLRRTDARHGYLVCTTCHRGPHPSTPECKECHRLPHGTDMHRRHPQCLSCHQDPHLLI